MTGGVVRIASLLQLRSTRPTIIIGMHRSGTSMLARQLHALGMHMGQDLTVNAESRCFQQLNRVLLAAGGASWSYVSPALSKMESSEYVQQQAVETAERLFKKNAMNTFWGARHKLLLSIGSRPVHWGWKDPRNSITLPVWMAIFPQAKVIHVVRNGIDVAISLHRRESRRADSSRDYSDRCLDFGYCFQLWEQYIRACRTHAKRLEEGHFLELHYEEILQQPERALGTVLGFVGREVKYGRLQRAVSTVDRSRIDNADFRREYAQQIANLQPSKLMAELGY